MTDKSYLAGRIYEKKGWLKSMTHKFDPKHAGRLDEPERKKILDPLRVLAPLNLAPGMHVADVGCGTGYFTLPMAEAVKETGKILAIDISRELLVHAEEKLHAAGIFNVDLITSKETSIPVPYGAVDAALVANVLHEVNGQTTFLREIWRLLKEDGVLLIVEWKKEETPHGPPLEDRLSPDQVVGLAELAGFGSRSVSEVGIYHYAVLLEKLT
ncbi:MAG: class I SAM-dependent methyltransferase [Bacillota bacterium]